MEEGSYINIELEDDSFEENRDSSSGFSLLQERIGDLFRHISAMLESPLHRSMSKSEQAAFHLAKENIQANPVWKQALASPSSASSTRQEFCSPNSNAQSYSNEKCTPGSNPDARVAGKFVSPKPVQSGTPLKQKCEGVLANSPLHVSTRSVALSPAAFVSDTKTPRKHGAHRTNSCHSASSSRVVTPSGKQREELFSLVSQLQGVVQTFGSKMAVFEERTRDLDSLKGMLTSLQNTVNSSIVGQPDVHKLSSPPPVAPLAAPPPPPPPPPPAPAPIPPPPPVSLSQTRAASANSLLGKKDEEKRAMSLAEALCSTPLLKRRRALLDKLENDESSLKAVPATELKLRSKAPVSPIGESLRASSVSKLDSKRRKESLANELESGTHPPMRDYMQEIMSGSYTLRRTNQRQDDGTIIVSKRTSGDRSPDPNNPTEVVFHALKRKFAQTYFPDEEEDDDSSAQKSPSGFDVVSGVNSKGEHVTLQSFSNPVSSPLARNLHELKPPPKSLLDNKAVSLESPTELQQQAIDNPFLVSEPTVSTSISKSDEFQGDDRQSESCLEESATSQEDSESVKSNDGNRSVSGQRSHKKKKKKRNSRR